MLEVEPSIAASCTDEQKARFLKPFLEDDTYLGKGISEPSAGSDNRLPPADDVKAGLKLKAERRGDEWILNGEKCFIANASVGKLFFIDARTNANVPVKDGTTMFLVPRDTPGFRIGKVFNKSGWRFYQNGEMIFEDARVPHANVVGEVNGAAEAAAAAAATPPAATCSAISSSPPTRSASATTPARWRWRTRAATSRAARSCSSSRIQLKLNRMHMLTEALRSLVMRVAWEHDHKLHSANPGLAMNFSTDVIQEVTELNMDVHGADGCTINPRVEKLVRDSIIWSHLAGDTVQRMKVARRLARSAA